MQKQWSQGKLYFVIRDKQTKLRQASLTKRKKKEK